MSLSLSINIMTINDLATARQHVIENWLPGIEQDLETSVVVFDERTEEHEWGWLFWGPKDPSAVASEESRWGYKPILVDRMSGNIYEVGTGGLKLTIAKLLWDRKC
jgi:hypothetical protein